MTPKKEYRNAVRSRMLIRAAFVNLLHEKPFERITATDIINRANINRSTFYAHYPDVKGIMDEITGEIIVLFREVLSGMDFSEFFEAPRPIIEKMVSFLNENQELYRLLGKSDMAYIQLEQLKRVMIRQVLESPNLPQDKKESIVTELRIRMLLGGVIDTYREWLAGEINCTLEEISAEISNIVVGWASH